MLLFPPFQLHSQNPYAEQFIGAPYVITIDISNDTAVRNAMEKAKHTTVGFPFQNRNDSSGL